MRMTRKIPNHDAKASVKFVKHKSTFVRFFAILVFMLEKSPNTLVTIIFPLCQTARI